MDIIWIIFAGLMFCGISKKKPGLMVPFIGLVGLMNVVRTSVTGRPVVPLSWNKKKILVPVSLCPGTRAGANVPGQTPLSRPGTK